VIAGSSEKWGKSEHAVALTPRWPLIAGYKCPRSGAACTELPLSGAGKIQKNELRERHRAGRGRLVA
jgi:acyl-CoA synthetase (AMP-forming)/AMP-acid ligase II